MLDSTRACQGDEKEKVNASSSDPPKENEPSSTGAQKIRRKRAKKIYSTAPTPDRLPSSEYCTTSEDEDENNEEEGGDNDVVYESDPVALHEDLHEALYGLPTPTKCLDPSTSGEIAPTELESTPGVEVVPISDREDSESVKSEKPSKDSTGAFKDAVRIKYTFDGVFIKMLLFHNLWSVILLFNNIQCFVCVCVCFLFVIACPTGQSTHHKGHC